MIEAMENSRKVRWVGSMGKMKCKVRHWGWYCMMTGLLLQRSYRGGGGGGDMIPHHYLHRTANCSCRI